MSASPSHGARNPKQSYKMLPVMVNWYQSLLVLYSASFTFGAESNGKKRDGKGIVAPALDQNLRAAGLSSASPSTSSKGDPIEHFHCRAVEPWVFTKIIETLIGPDDPFINCETRCGLHTEIWFQAQMDSASRDPCFALETDFCYSSVGVPLTSPFPIDKNGIQSVHHGKSYGKSSGAHLSPWLQYACLFFDERFRQYDTEEQYFLATMQTPLLGSRDLQYKPPQAKVAPLTRGTLAKNRNDILADIFIDVFSLICRPGLRKLKNKAKGYKLVPEFQLQPNLAGEKKVPPPEPYQQICHCTLYLAASRVYQHSGTAAYRQKISAMEDQGESKNKPKLDEYLKQPNTCDVGQIGRRLATFGWLYNLVTVKYEYIDCDADFFVCQCVGKGALSCSPPEAWIAKKLKEEMKAQRKRDRLRRIADRDGETSASGTAANSIPDPNPMAPSIWK